MQVYLFFTNHCITTFTFLMYILVSLEVSFNVSCSFGHDDVNQLWCFEVLIWLKIDYFWKYLRTYKSKKKKKILSNLILTFRGKWESIKHASKTSFFSERSQEWSQVLNYTGWFKYCFYCSSLLCIYTKPFFHFVDCLCNIAHCYYFKW